MPRFFLFLYLFFTAFYFIWFYSILFSFFLIEIFATDDTTTLITLYGSYVYVKYLLRYIALFCYVFSSFSILLKTRMSLV